MLIWSWTKTKILNHPYLKSRLMTWSSPTSLNQIFTMVDKQRKRAYLIETPGITTTAQTSTCTDQESHIMLQKILREVRWSTSY